MRVVRAVVVGADGIVEEDRGREIFWVTREGVGRNHSRRVADQAVQ